MRPRDLPPAWLTELATFQRSRLGALVGWAVVFAVLGGMGTGWVLTSDVLEDEDEEEIVHGAELYQRNCAICHANDGSGIAGVAPPITIFSAPRVDLSMRTGRMPIADPARGLRDPSPFTDEQRRATMAYLEDKLDLEGEVPDVPDGEAARGRDVYAVNCAQCHAADGKGGVAGDGVQIPPVVGLDEVTIAASTREGPFAMPKFGPELISDQEIGDMVAFLDEDVHAPTSPIGRATISKFEAVFFAALLTVGMLLVCIWAAGVRQRRPAPPPGKDEAGPDVGEEG